MSRHCVAFAVLALTGALLSGPEPAAAAGGVRGLPGGFRTPLTIRQARANLLRPALRGFHGAHGFARHRTGTFAHPVIPPSPHGFATTTPLRPFAGLVRRHHSVYRSGWSYPITTGDETGYIGMPYDPAEAIPVYGPAPQAGDPPPPTSALTRTAPAADETRDACRSEQVKVPATEGERTITVVRC